MNILHTFPNQIPKLEIKKAKGPFLYLSNGLKILDATSGSTSNCILGYSDKRIINKMSEQLKKITNIDIKAWRNPEMYKLSKLITDNSIKNMNMVFFTGQSGSEACEAAMLLSHQTHLEMGNFKKKLFISTFESYHGSTLNSLAAGDRKHLKYLKPLHPSNHIKISENDPIRNKKKGETDHQYLLRLLKEFKNKITKYGAENISAFIGEPILGQLQGDIIPVKDYWKNISKICLENNIHLIMDEVYTGLGISGKYNSTMWEKICPDFICIGKTLGAGYSPMSAVLLNNKVSNVIKEGSGRVSYSTTHQGHSLGVSAALAVQKIIISENLSEKAQKMGAYMMNVLKNELQNLDYYNGVHGRGLRFSLFHKLGNKSDFCNNFKNIMFDKYNILIDSKWHRIGFRTQMNLDIKNIDRILESTISTFKTAIK